MASDSSNTTDHRRPTTTGKAQSHHLFAPPHQEHIPCPRCDSTNTKFCYYNNYNFSQPRHYCKSCRRYWTHGGALRDVPVGGGTRKRAKRLRVSTDSDDSPAPVVVTTHIGSGFVGTTSTAPAVVMPFAGVHGGGMSCNGFTSLLSNGQSLGGIFGVGFDQGLSFGLGRTVWPFSVVGDGGVGGSAAVSGGGNGWPLESGDSGSGGGGGGECFGLPELAISTPGNAMK